MGLEAARNLCNQIINNDNYYEIKIELVLTFNSIPLEIDLTS